MTGWMIVREMKKKEKNKSKTKVPQKSSGLKCEYSKRRGPCAHCTFFKRPIERSFKFDSANS